MGEAGGRSTKERRIRARISVRASAMGSPPPGAEGFLRRGGEVAADGPLGTGPGEVGDAAAAGEQAGQGAGFLGGLVAAGIAKDPGEGGHAGGFGGALSFAGNDRGAQVGQ